jgi:hypothetical protein
MKCRTNRRRPLCLALLLALVCGLLAGPHPCQALEPAAAPAHAAAPGEMACGAHHTAGAAPPESPAPAASGERDCCAEHGSDCTYACQALAGVVRAAALPAAGAAADRALAPTCELDLPLFANAIDHIPLA